MLVEAKEAANADMIAWRLELAKNNIDRAMEMVRDVAGSTRPEPSESKLSEFSVGDEVALDSDPGMRGRLIKSALYAIGDGEGILHTVKWKNTGDIGSGYEDDDLRKVDKPKAEE